MEALDRPDPLCRPPQRPSETAALPGSGVGGRLGSPAAQRGLAGEAAGGMAGLRGSGWEEAVGEGRRTSGRASSRRAAATLTLIRWRVTKWRIGPQWPPPALRRRGVRGIGGSVGRGGRAENAADGLEARGAVLCAGVLPARKRAFGPPRR